MNTLNEIRIKLTDFGRQFLRKDSTIDIAALINNTAKDIVTLLDTRLVEIIDRLYCLDFT